MFAKLSKEATKDENGLPAVGPSAVPSDTREGWSCSGSVHPSGSYPTTWRHNRLLRGVTPESVAPGFVCRIRPAGTDC